MNLRTVRVAPTRLLDEVISVTRAHLPAPDVVNKLADNSVLGTVLAAGSSEMMLIISADATAAHQSVINVMDAARRAGIAKLTFATQSSSGGAKP